METCSQDLWPDNREWLKAFSAKAARERVPVAGMLELTRACNLHCIHCYNLAAKPAVQAEMSTAQVKDLVDQVVAAGCLYFTFTGGDPMAHPHFPELYAYARQKGLVVHVLCNGTLVTEEVLSVFSRHPPGSVEVTFYGANAATHDRVTGVPGSFETAWNGVRALRQRGVYVALKTLLMTANTSEVAGIRSMAREVGCRYRVDPLIFPRFPDGDRAPLALRVTPRQAVEIEFADERLRTRWREAFERLKEAPPAERLYECGAARTCFFIDAMGWISPCLMMPFEKHDALGTGFQACWDAMAALRTKVPTPDYPCRTCEIRALCPSCAAVNRLETGSEMSPCEYACRIAKWRHRMLTSQIAGVAS